MYSGRDLDNTYKLKAKNKAPRTARLRMRRMSHTNMRSIGYFHWQFGASPCISALILFILRFYGMMRVYFVPSRVAPRRSPACAKTTAITGLNVVVVSAAKESP